MCRHSTNGPCDGRATEIERGHLIRVESLANHPGLVPTLGTKSGLERFTRRDRNGLKVALDDIDWIGQLNHRPESRGEQAGH